MAEDTTAPNGDLDTGPSDAPVISIDLSGIVVGWNGPAESLYGYSSAEILGQPFSLVQPVGPFTEEGALTQLARDGECVEHVQAVHKTREGRFLKVTLSLLGRNRESISIIVQHTSDQGARAGSADEAMVWTWAVVETAVEGIITIDEDATIEYMNPAAQTLFGYRLAEARGHNVNMLMPSPYREEHDGYLAAYLSTGVKRIIGIGREVVGLRKDGSTFPMHLAVSEVLVGNKRIFTGIIHDISTVRRAQEEKDRILQELNRRNREINCLYRVSEMVRSAEIDGRIFQDVIREVMSTMTHPSAAGFRILFDGKTFDGENCQETQWKHEAPIIAGGRKRGAVEGFFLEDCAAAVADSWLEGEMKLIDAVAGILSGTIDRKEAEAKVIHASKLASIGELAAGVGHEINNPINGIINCADILIEKSDDGTDAHRFAELIRSEADRIAVIVRNLLTFSRQEKEMHSAARVCDIVDSVLSLCGKKLSKSYVLLEVDVPEDLPRIHCRSEQLQQVVMNVVINGMHALDERYPGPDPDKKLLIRGTSRSVDGKSSVQLVVEDHGTGISPSQIERIFDPFFTTKGRDRGTGLGLSVSDGIVKEHGGVMSVESEEGVYTRFTIDLPAGDGETLVARRSQEALRETRGKGN